MSIPFSPPTDSGSCVDLRQRVFQSVQSANIDDQIIEVIKKALEAQNVKLASEDLTRKLDYESIPV